MGVDLDRIQKRKYKVTKKYLNRYLTSLAIREMQIKLLRNFIFYKPDC